MGASDMHTDTAQVDTDTAQPVPFVRALLDWVVAGLLVTGVLHASGLGVSGSGFSIGVERSPTTSFERVDDTLTANSVLKFVLVLALIILVVLAPLPEDIRGPTAIV